MRKLALFSLLVFNPSTLAGPSKVLLNFDDFREGSALSGWTSGFYSVKGAPKWTVVRDALAPSGMMVLAQTGQATYSWLVRDDLKMKNGFIEADFKIISGREDPEAGLVWRHKDGRNYYYVRANAIEDNVIFYRMNRGNKEVVKVADMKTPFKTWHHLKVQFQDDQVEIVLDGKAVVTVRDNTFKESGRVGFFTTADTVSSFDNFAYGDGR